MAAQDARPGDAAAARPVRKWSRTTSESVGGGITCVPQHALPLPPAGVPGSALRPGALGSPSGGARLGVRPQLSAEDAAAGRHQHTGRPRLLCEGHGGH